MTGPEVLSLKPGTLLGFYNSPVVIRIVSFEHYNIMRYKFVSGTHPGPGVWEVPYNEDIACYVLTSLLKELI